ncbi:UDP-N-acetylmuramoyl-L-alanine--D-glutamate ligase [Candidatus Parcubacteria bacterium]|nr:UDP-N-acetylmuramoyl-L-alanine--D-glutamate ligase [Candidatus Parcubacteria bacterium]
MGRFAEFKNKRVLIMGLGLHGGGVGAARFFAQAGAQVTATDLRSASELAPSLKALEGLPVRYVLGRHREEDVLHTDLVIQNPGVPANSPYLRVARRAGIAIDTDVGVFARLCPAPTIGITGTKGKSTTATLIAQCLKRHFKSVVLAGNIRTSVLSVLGAISPATKVVLELSSWQLEGLAKIRFSPHMAVITNIFPEHLNRYRSFDAYARAKGLIAKHQTRQDHLFIPHGNPLIRKVTAGTKARVHVWSRRDALPDDLRVRGEHNYENMRAAQAVARFIGVSKADVGRVFKSFRGLEGRCEVVRRLGGITYINDTTATMPEAAIAAIEAMPRPPIVIAGGADKNLDYSGLARAIERRAKAVVLIRGSATDKLKPELGGRPPEVGSMAQAVRLARKQARPGDTVLLSPGAASFGLFLHEFDRGQKFVEAVSKLKR